MDREAVCAVCSTPMARLDRLDERDLHAVLAMMQSPGFSVYIRIKRAQLEQAVMRFEAAPPDELVLRQAEVRALKLDLRAPVDLGRVVEDVLSKVSTDEADEPGDEREAFDVTVDSIVAEMLNDGGERG